MASLRDLTRAQEVSVALTMALLVLVVVFPHAQYNYSAGFPRGTVVWEWQTRVGHYDPEDAAIIGRRNYYSGTGIVPCWNIDGKTVLWDVVAIEAALVLLLGVAAYYANRRPAAETEAAHTDALPAKSAPETD